MDSAHPEPDALPDATHLGLGAFYTAAINDGDIGDRLGLDPSVRPPSRSGFGIRAARTDSLNFDAQAHDPVAAAVTSCEAAGLGYKGCSAIGARETRDIMATPGKRTTLLCRSSPRDGQFRQRVQKDPLGALAEYGFHPIENHPGRRRLLHRAPSTWLANLDDLGPKLTSSLGIVVFKA